VKALGWMEPSAYFRLAKRSLEEKVIRPLRERGIDPGPIDVGKLPVPS
jgi:hypothetical protein